MSTRRTRKRKREDSSETVGESGAAICKVNGEPAAPTGSTPTRPSGEDVFSDALQDKDQAIWESFREEYIESVEQLPLSLHRTFKLMRELDTHAMSSQSKLLPALLEYISKRKEIERRRMERQQPISESAEVDVPLPSDATVECAGERDKTEPLDIHRTVTGMSPNGVARKSKSTTPSQGGSESVAVSGGKRASSRTSAVSQTERITITPNRTSESDSGYKPSLSSTSQRRTDEILPQISMHVGELLRASEEKVNLAQAAYDSVDRHVRLLDQAIREQESRLPADSRSRGGLDLQTTNGTFTLSSRTPLENGLYMLADAAQEEDEATVLTNGRMPTEKTSRQKRGHRRKVLEGSRSRPAPEEVNTTSGPVGVVGAVLGVPDATSVLSDMPINPNEPRYCYCNEFSFGEMIGCDNPECEKEWFHLGCVGLTEPPKKRKWFCDDCKAKRGKTVAGTTRKKG